jgi:hypothetical protein
MATTLGDMRPMLDKIMGFSAMDQYGFCQFGSGYVTQKGFASLHDYKRFQHVDTPDVNDMPLKVIYWGNKEDGVQYTMILLDDGSILEHEGHPDDHLADLFRAKVHADLNEALEDVCY